MSERERGCCYLVRQAAEHRLSQLEASERLGIGVRQFKRLVRAYKQEGDGSAEMATRLPVPVIACGHCGRLASCLQRACWPLVCRYRPWEGWMVQWRRGWRDDRKGAVTQTRTKSRATFVFLVILVATLGLILLTWSLLAGR